MNYKQRWGYVYLIQCPCVGSIYSPKQICFDITSVSEMIYYGIIVSSTE